MESTLLAQGVELMLAGMGTVFVFLTLLVLVTTAMSALVRRFFTEVQAQVAVAATEEEVAAITAAIARHRSRGEPRE